MSPYPIALPIKKMSLPFRVKSDLIFFIFCVTYYIPYRVPVHTGLFKSRPSENSLSELQSKIVMFQNVNKHWRAHLERLFREVIWRAHNSFIDTTTQWTPEEPTKEPPQTPSGLSNVCLHFGTLRS